MMLNLGRGGREDRSGDSPLFFLFIPSASPEATRGLASCPCAVHRKSSNGALFLIQGQEQLGAFGQSLAVQPQNTGTQISTLFLTFLSVLLRQGFVQEPASRRPSSSICCPDRPVMSCICGFPLREIGFENVGITPVSIDERKGQTG